MVREQDRAWRGRVAGYFIFVKSCCKIFSNEIPVDEVPESRDIVGAGISIVDVVGVFPDIAGKECFFS